MLPLKSLQPRTRKVNRSDLRQEQSTVLSMAKGKTVVVVAARGKADEKFILDKQYFEELVSSLRSAIETLEITADRKLYARLLKAAESLEEDTRQGKLNSFEDVFAEN